MPDDLDLEGLDRELEEAVAEEAKAVAVEVHDRIVRRTPYRDGAAKASWRMSLDTPDETTEEPAPGERFSESEAEGLAKETQACLSGFKPYENTIEITNSLPYIGQLESGTSTQAPAGMVALTLAELGGDD